MKKSIRRIFSSLLSIAVILGSFNIGTIQANAEGTFNITATSNNSGYGSVSINWSDYNYSNKNFKVYKSSDDGATYESVGIDYTSVKEVKVLQVYPDQGSGQLRSWLVNSGYGQGVITVGEVSITNFNRNPSNYLYETADGWSYDVVFFGTWDRNNFRDLSYASYLVVNKFAQAGKGVILGHDVALNNGRGDIYEYSGGSVKNSQNYFDSLTTTYMPLLYFQSGQEISGTQVKIIKKGLFTTYPNYIGEIGTVLNIPSCHSWGQRVRPGYESNIWLNYTSSNVNGGGNFYLVSYNNFAMIQTGHSNGAATADEQKILANLVFYMNQLLFNTYTTNDNSAQDVAPPSNPEIRFNDDNTVSFSSSDSGTTYKYYVESYDKNNTTPTGLLDTSNVEEVSVLTGFDCYRYIYDNNANTVLNSTTGIEVTGSSIEYDDSKRYLHVAAIDNAGNASETMTIDLWTDHTITTSCTGSGCISDSSVVKFGTDASIFIIPAEGFSLTGLIIDGVSVSPVNNYNLLKVKSDRTITATFTMTQTKKMQLLSSAYSWINLNLT